MEPGPERYDVAVVGCGLIGASAAKYLGAGGARVVLVGPEAVADGALAAPWPGGPPAPALCSSHDDRSRITRVFDPDPFWAEAAARSVARYRRIEQEAGVGFFSEVGVLALGPAQPRQPTGDQAAPADSSQPYDLDALAGSVRAHGVDVERCSPRQLAEHYRFLSPGDGVAGLLQPRAAGWIDPRAFLAAQIRLAARSGVALWPTTVERLDVAGDGVTVVSSDGAVARARRVLLATGAATDLGGLAPVPLGIRARAATVVHARLTEADAARLADAPALIAKPPDPTAHCYLVPPARYPDGRAWLKIGGAPGVGLGSVAALRRWCAGPGDTSTTRRLAGVLGRLLPDVQPEALHPQPCVVALTASSRPVIGVLAGGRVAVAAGGNGFAAKSADELGRRAAALLLGGADAPEPWPHDQGSG